MWCIFCFAIGFALFEIDLYIFVPVIVHVNSLFAIHYNASIVVVTFHGYTVTLMSILCRSVALNA